MFAGSPAPIFVLSILSWGIASAALGGEDARPREAKSPAGLCAADWSGIRAAYETERHKFVAVGAGWRARNPSQQWVSHFDERGFTTHPDDGSWTWGLELTGYGWGEAQPIGSAAHRPEAEEGRLVRHWDATLTEWYLQDSRGLEHGFTITHRASHADSPLIVDLSIRGGLLPTVSKDGRDVAFNHPQRGSALRYDGLTVIDSVGRNVDARWTAIATHRLRLQVDDALAHYPLTIDPIAQQAYLKASNTGADDRFGEAVAISGDTVVVGAPLEDSAAVGVNGNQADNSAPGAGAAYVFVRTGTTWSQQAYLKASNTDPNDNFGSAVAVSGDTLVVGAWAEKSAADTVNGNQANNDFFNAGAAYVFVRNGTTWSQQSYLKAVNCWSGDLFGWSVAVSGDILVVGAPGEESNATGVNGNWSDNSAPDSGAAYIFVRSGTTWFEQAYLKASNTGQFDLFGRSVAISGTTVVVGAPAEDSQATGVNGDSADNSATDSGAAYVFVRLAIGGIWIQQAYLKPSNTGSGDAFGSSVAITLHTIVAGAPFEDSNSTGVNSNQVNNSASNAGAAYVLFRSGTTWSQQAYLKPSNTGANDQFGSSVGVSGNLAIVGAPREASHGTGVNGNEASNSAANAGAAYVFTRSATFWTQQAHIKASNTDANDTFGTSVGVSIDTAVVGAPGEASNATGANGNQANNSASSAGAAYVFNLSDSCGTLAYGTGTPGCAGTHTLSVNQCPQIGRDSFAITGDKAPSLSLGLGIITDFQDLAGSDAFGVGILIHCNLLSATEVLTFDFPSNASGFSQSVGTGIPNSPLLIGKTYYVSALWAWPTCSLPPNNLSSSRGLAITILAP